MPHRLENDTPSESYGIAYTPQSHHQVPRITIDQLKAIDTHTIRLTWLDLTNIPRYRALPIEYFSKLLEKSSRPGITFSKGAMGLVGVTVARGFGPNDEYLYVVDMNTIRLCPYALGHASVMGWFEEKVARPSVGLKVPVCPRTLLHRVVEDAKRAGTSFLVGFETEFTLLKSTKPITPVNQYGWCLSAALFSGSVEAEVMDEIASALKASGIELQMIHSEGAPGQYEVVTGPLPPLEAADALLHTREVIYNVANKHKLRATLAPRVAPDSCGTGAHAHISVHSSQPAPSPPSGSTSYLSSVLTLLPALKELRLPTQEYNARVDDLQPGLTSISASFLSAVLTHLPALTALMLPIPASYARMVDGIRSGGTYVCWGNDAREVPVRLCNARSLGGRNFELKTMDGIANPYLVLAGVLGVGMRGIKEKRKLAVSDCAMGGGLRSVAEMKDEERAALGITQRLPLTWEAAREELRRDEVVGDVLGQEMVQTYLNVNEHLTNMLKRYDKETEEDAFVRLIETY